jgi:hypothetical protein
VWLNSAGPKPLREHFWKSSILPAEGRPDVVAELVSQRADVNARGANGQMPLHLAVLYYLEQAPQERSITIFLIMART